MPQSKKNSPRPAPHSYQLLSKITDIHHYKMCLRSHIACSDSDSDSSGASDFNEEYYKNRPPPIKVNDSPPNLPSSNVQTAEESNTMTIDGESGAVAKTIQTEDATLTQSVPEANLKKKKRKRAKKKAKLTPGDISELYSVLTESAIHGNVQKQNANVESELNARSEPNRLRIKSVSELNLSAKLPDTSLSEIIASQENLDRSLARLEKSVNETIGDHNFTTPFIEVKSRRSKKRTHSNTSPSTPQLYPNNIYVRTCASSPSVLVSKKTTKEQAAVEESIKSQIRTSPLWFHFENCEMTLREMELLHRRFVEENLQEGQENCAVKVGKKALRKARARLTRNLSLDFSSFINMNLQGEQSVERLLEKQALIAGFTETEPQVPQDCVVKVGKKATRTKQRDVDIQVDCKPPMPQFEQQRVDFVKASLQELQSVDRPMKTRLIPDSSKMKPQVKQKDCAIKVARKPSRKAMTRLGRNLSLDFSSFIDLNLQGNQTLERLLETHALVAGLSVTEQNSEPQADCTADFEYSRDLIAASEDLTANSGGLTANSEGLTPNFGDLIANSEDLTANSGDLSRNIGELTADSEDLTANSGDLTANSECITAHSGDLTANSVDLTANSGDLTANYGDLTADSEDLTAISGDLTANYGDLIANFGDLIANSEDFTANSGDLSGNIGELTAISEDLTVNSGDLTANSGDFFTANSEDVTSNSDDFADLTADFEDLSGDLDEDFVEDRFSKAYEIIGRILNESNLIEDGRRWEASDFRVGMEAPHQFINSGVFIRFLECSNNIAEDEKAEIGKLLYHKLEESKKEVKQSKASVVCEDDLSDIENYTDSVATTKKKDNSACLLGSELSCSQENTSTENFLASSDDLTPYFYSVESKLHMDRHLKGFDSLGRSLLTSPQLRHVDHNRVSKSHNFYRNYVEKYTSCEFQAGIFQVSYQTMVDSLLTTDF